MEHIIEGIVVEGRQLGRELGFPTANIELQESLSSADGVYLSRVECEKGTFQALSNLGTNPTVGGNRRRLETHLIDYDKGPLYGMQLRITLLERLREEEKFENIADLRRQIEEDVRRARHYFEQQQLEEPFANNIENK